MSAAINDLEVARFIWFRLPNNSSPTDPSFIKFSFSKLTRNLHSPPLLIVLSKFCFIYTHTTASSTPLSQSLSMVQLLRRRADSSLTNRSSTAAQSMTSQNHSRAGELLSWQRQVERQLFSFFMRSIPMEEDPFRKLQAHIPSLVSLLLWQKYPRWGDPSETNSFMLYLYFSRKGRAERMIRPPIECPIKERLKLSPTLKLLTKDSTYRDRRRPSSSRPSSVLFQLILEVATCR